MASSLEKMAIHVTDARSNPNDQIAHAAAVLKRSPGLRAVFEAICKGGKKPKTVAQLMKTTGFDQVPVLQLAGKLADQQLVHKSRANGQTLYEKDRFYAANRGKVLSLATHPAKLKRLPTKYSPKPSASGTVIKLLGAKIQVAEVTCDDFDQFAKVKKVTPAPLRAKGLSETAIKKGFARLIGETGKFQDWGGEKNDLYTSKIRHEGKRRSIAFALKGPGTSGELTPKKLGKNGDQIQRLFESPAQVFVVQYHGQINQSVVAQMKEFAKAKSVSDGTPIWYGIIDGDDTDRILAAYPTSFGLK
jgi:hypothetical protein